jgi:hypothetical protein
MARAVFTSFHFQRDVWRANVVRNSWLTKGGESNAFFDKSLWEEAQKKGDGAIKRMIDKALIGTSVTAVLIGTDTATRKYVQYEVQQSVAENKGLFGVYIHQIQNHEKVTDTKGRSPFTGLSGIATYDWVNDDGYKNFHIWVEKAAKAAGR